MTLPAQLSPATQHIRMALCAYTHFLVEARKWARLATDVTFLKIQVAGELKKTAYKPKMAILGARKHYCINEAVRERPEIDEACKDKCASTGGCEYKKDDAIPATPPQVFPPPLHGYYRMTSALKWRCVPD